MEMKTVKLQDVCVSITDGTHQAPPKSKDGVPFITISNITTDNRLDYSVNTFVPFDFYESINDKQRAKIGDILYSVVGSFGKTVFINDNKPFVFQRHIAILRPGDNVNNKYLYYILSSPDFYRKADLVALGAAQRTISLKNLRDMEVNLSPRPIQDKIASILSAYDDMIDNCKRQIALLEEAAQRLYREWFIDMRFFNHKKALFNSTGIPSNWSYQTLESIGVQIESGRRPKGGILNITDGYTDGIPSIGAENVIGLGQYQFEKEKFIDSDFFFSMKRGHLKDGDILIYKDGAYIGKTTFFQDGFPHKQAAVNEHVFLLRATNSDYQKYLFLTLHQPEYFDRMQRLNANSAQPGLNQKHILGLTILLPDVETILEFNRLVSPIFSLIFAKANLRRQIMIAKKSLLPRLISGQIEINA